MTAPTVPADVRAAAEALHITDDIGPWRSAPFAEQPATVQERYILRARAALAASDAVRREGAGDVVERLAAICGPSMQQCQCRSDQSDCGACTCGHAAALITTLRADNARLSDELETERMRLVACGVVAMANTTESAAKNREMHPSYRSASCDDVARAVDREMTLRAEVERLREALEELCHVQVYSTGWDNGVTDSTGTMNEGAHWHSRAMDKARTALGGTP